MVEADSDNESLDELDDLEDQNLRKPRADSGKTDTGNWGQRKSELQNGEYQREDKVKLAYRETNIVRGPFDLSYSLLSLLVPYYSLIY